MQRAQDRVEGTAWEGHFSVQVSAKLLSTQWGCRVQDKRRVRQGVPVVALAKRSPKDLCVRGYTSHMVTDGKGEFAGSGGSFWGIFSTYHSGNQPLNSLAVNSELTQHS